MQPHARVATHAAASPPGVRGGMQRLQFPVTHTPPRLTFNYELFNCNNVNIHSWSWNYRGCWHQTCPPMDPCEGI